MNGSPITQTNNHAIHESFPGDTMLAASWERVGTAPPTEDGPPAGNDFGAAAALEDELSGNEFVGDAPLEDVLAGNDSVGATSVGLLAGSEDAPESPPSLEGSGVTNGGAVVVTGPSGLKDNDGRKVGTGIRPVSIQKLSPAVGHAYPNGQHPPSSQS
ncbi:hypothetical protein N7510_001348 [Penicillium lagena]|uniref:uncharacterized protein n=1 Tax=Penicillium lagena TaxID=94218 RepID=UPI0025401B97|nr:uncharacterized protein N7510_001348 [Penicillium lagena]KAJ5625039.1 hypothetical protein N7510_001348 [Penicillium lagena]